MAKKAKATQDRSRYNLRPQKPKATEAESNDEVETDVATSSAAPAATSSAQATDAAAQSASAAPTALKRNKKGRGGVKKRKKATVNPRAHRQFTNFSAPMMFTNAGPPNMTYSNSVYGPMHPSGQMTSGVASGFSPYPPQMTMGAPRVYAPPSGRMVGSSPHLQRMMTGPPQVANNQQHNQMMSGCPQAVNHQQLNQMMSGGPLAVNHQHHNQMMSGGPQAVNHQQLNQPSMGPPSTTWNNILDTTDSLRRTIENIMLKTELDVNNACHQHGYGHLVQQPLLLGNQGPGPVRSRPVSSFPGMNQMSRNNMAGRQHVSMMSGQMAGRPGQQVGRSGPQRVVQGVPQQLRKQRDGMQQQVQQQRVVQGNNQIVQQGSDQVGEQQVQQQGGQKKSEQQVDNQVQQEEQAARMAQGEEAQQGSSVEVPAEQGEKKSVAPAEQGEKKNEEDAAFKVPLPPASK